MVFGPDTSISLNSAVELVNTNGAVNVLASVADLDGIFVRYNFTGAHARTEAELNEVRAIRSQLRELLTGTREQIVEKVNGILMDAVAVPQLVRHDSLDWHIHAASDESPLATRILVETAMAMIDVLRADELDRITACEATSCNNLMVDLTRNRSRRYCSVNCGNRMAAAAYRVRQKQPQ